jgi:catechol 2,3-dioxygenase-like lactoylglutathione lyase family enzyme
VDATFRISSPLEWSDAPTPQRIALVSGSVLRWRVSGPSDRQERLVSAYPELMHTALDTTQARELADFYRQLLGLRYRSGDEPPSDGTPDDRDWLVLVDDDGRRKLAFQQVSALPRSTWPSHEVPMQMHIDFAVPTVEDLQRHRQRAEELGAEVLLDRTNDDGEPLYVLADPAGHPFCLLVA